MNFFFSNSGRLLTWAFLTLALCTGTVWSQNDSERTPDISELWATQVLVFSNNKSRSESEEAQVELMEFLRDNGVVRAPEISAAYVKLGLNAIESDRRSDAEWAFKSALQADPYNVRAAQALVNNSWHIGIGEIFSSFGTRVRVAFFRLSFIGFRHLIFGNAALVMIFTFLLFATITIVVVFFHQVPLFIHEIHHQMPFVTDPRITSLAVFIGFVCLWLSPAGLPGCLVATLLIGFAFSHQSRRIFVWISWALIFFIFPLAIVHVYSFVVEDSRLFRVARYALNEGYSEPVISELKSLAQQESDVKKLSRIHYMMGILYKKGGFFNDARREFEIYRDVFPQDARVFINLGNIEFINDRVKTAAELYRKAESLDPRNPIVFFNLSKAYLSQFRFDEAQDMQNQALKLDPDLTNKLNSNHSSKLIRMVADVDVPEQWLADETADRWNFAYQKIDSYWIPLYMGLKFNNLLYCWIIITIAMLLIQIVSHRFLLSRFCLKCGKPMKPDMKSGGTDHICVSCHMVYFKKSEAGRIKSVPAEGVPVKPVNWDSIVHKILSCLIPGSGRLYSGHLFTGLTMLFIWCLGVGAFLASPYQFPTYFRIPSGITGIGQYIIIFFLILDYLVSVRWGFEEEDV